MRNFFLKIVISILILISTMGCLSSNISSIKFDIYRLKYKFPFVKSNGELIYLNDSSELIYYRDYIIAKINFNNIKIDSSEVKNNCKYFIFKEGKKNGFWFESILFQNPNEKSINTILNKYFFAESKFLPQSNDSLVKIIRKINEIEYFFLTKIKFDENYPDTSIYRFIKQDRRISYSLSKEIDTLKNFKLESINFVFNSSKNDKFDFIIPARKLEVEFFQVRTSNEYNLKKFIEDFSRAYPDY